MSPAEFDDAMCTYLGGDNGSGAIQIGGGDERLKEKYGTGHVAIKNELDLVLEATIEHTGDGYTNDGHSIGSWLATELPSLAIITRQKIEAHVLYRILH
ncbi:MAG: hypothetical protein ACK56W_05355 [Pirellula sp.]|nr:hypothetical protein [Pirellula sp.]